jgi:parvulin-like peptidyl-prolyl isomerase
MGARFRSKIEIRHENIEEYFNSHIDEYYAEPSVRLAVLLLDGTDKKIIQHKLKAIRQGLRTNESFSALVKQFSDGPGAAQGGDLGYLHKGEISPLIENIAQNLKIGEVSKPVREDNLIYIVKLVDKKGKEPRPIKEVERQIHSIIYKKMLKQRYDYWLDDMKRTAFIDVRL